MNTGTSIDVSPTGDTERSEWYIRTHNIFCLFIHFVSNWKRSAEGWRSWKGGKKLMNRLKYSIRCICI